MSNADIISMCFRNLVKRKLRTFLTILGVVIGTASIVVMVSLGLAINLKFDQEIANMGDVTVITVYNPANGWYSDDASQSFTGERPKLDDAAIQNFEKIDGVVVATPLATTSLYFKSGRYILSWANIYGIKPEAMSLLGYQAAEGRLLEDGDQYNVVFGAHAEKNFYDPQGMNNDRFWQAMTGNEVETLVHVFRDKITMSYDSRYVYGNQDTEAEYDFEDMDAPKPIIPYDVKVVGVLEPKNDYYTTDGAIFMDIELVKKLRIDAARQQQENNQEWGYYSAIQNNPADNGYETAYVKCTDLATVRKVKEAIEALGYYCNIPTQYLDYLQEQASSQQTLLGAIGAVSLFVAAIGIANTMIMAIYERTREIGVMKVIGAAISDIRKLFLLEAAMIGFFGGGFGVLLSLGVSYLLNNFDLSLFGDQFNYIGEPGTGVVSYIPLWLCGVSMLFAVIVGLTSGYFPARRAMRLSALSAIRTE